MVYFLPLGKLTQMFRSIKLKLSALTDTHTLEVISKSLSSSFVKVFGMALAFLMSIYLGRVLGADGLGIINLSFRIVTVLMIFGMLGMTQIIIREVAIASEENNQSQIGSVLYTAYLFNGGLTLILSLIFIFLTPYLANNVFNEPRLTFPLMIALLVMIPQVFSQMFAATLVGKRKIWQSSLADQCLNVLITVSLLFCLWIKGIELTINITAIAYGIGRLFVTLFMGIYWRKVLFKYNHKNYIFRDLLSKSYPVLIASLSLALITNSGIIFLGVMSDSKDVGLYSVATRLAELTTFLLHVVNSSVSPKISSLYKQGKKNELEVMLKRTSKILCLIGLIFLVVFALTGKYILQIWGDEFINAYWILMALCLGQFVNISTGAVGQLLTMTGNQKQQRNIAIKCMLCVLIIMSISMAILGPIGAAISTSFGIIAINISTLVCAQRITGITIIRFRKQHI